MDFARKQLEKYGWSTGKGLGKHENGISEALKPKIKRSVTGIGHNAAEDFTEHWWTALYNKAAENVEFKQKSDDSKKFKTKDDNAFEITNSTWKLNRKHKESPNEEYKNFFVKTEILANDGTKYIRESESESEVDEKKDVFKLTDEELFAACGGRTAHKAARFGLKATGKLARIKQQEEKLLDLDKYNGYSHTKNRGAESINPDTDGNDNDAKLDSNIEMVSDNSTQKKKKKKRKHKNMADLESEVISEDIVENKQCDDNSEESNKDNSNVETIKKKEKLKRKIAHSVEIDDVIESDTQENDTEIKIKNKKCKINSTENESIVVEAQTTNVDVTKVKKKKNKKGKNK